jgi:FKBP-type peptidyl-prolyl cis-trans isomerase
VSAPVFTEEQLVEEVGWLVAKRGSLTELQFSQTQVDAMVKGFAAAMSGKDAPYDVQKMEPQLNAFMQARQTALLGRLKEKGVNEASAFFTQLKANKNVVELPSGLRYEILKPGNGAYPKPTETVVVHYTGKLVDGSVFDSSVQRGQPAEFQLDQVIPGWTEGIQKINKGGRIKLYIPASLAYGDEGRPGIPPGATLIFEVELLDIKGATPPKG